MAKSKEEQRIYRHEYYIANKDRELELHRIWKENNSEKFAQLQQEYRENNREFLAEYSREYNKAYRENNSDAIRKYKKQFYEKHRRECVYLLISKDLKVIYCGSTSNIYKRIENHAGCWSHLELTEEKWRSLNCSHFEYCYLDNATKEERLYVESLLISKFEPTLNSYEPIRFNNITEDRKAELESMVDDLVFKIWNR